MTWRVICDRCGPWDRELGAKGEEDVLAYGEDRPRLLERVLRSLAAIVVPLACLWVGYQVAGTETHYWMANAVQCWTR